MQPARQDLLVTPGTTYRDVVRIMQPELEYRDISAIAGAPAVFTVAAHGLASTWPIWVRGVTGMPEINREPGRQPPHRAERLDADSLQVNAQSAIGLKPTGGQLIYRRPVDLTDALIFFQVQRGPEVLLELSDGNGIQRPAPGTLIRELSADQTALLAGEGLTYTFDVHYPGGVITRYFEGGIPCMARQA